MTVVLVWKAPFNTMGLLSLGIDPIKKCPHVRLHAPRAERYNASECMFIIISDASNLTFAGLLLARQSNNCTHLSIVLSVAFCVFHPYGAEGHEDHHVHGVGIVYYASHIFCTCFIPALFNFGVLSGGAGACAVAPNCLGSGAYGQF